MAVVTGRCVVEYKSVIDVVGYERFLGVWRQILWRWWQRLDDIPQRLIATKPTSFNETVWNSL